MALCNCLNLKSPSGFEANRILCVSAEFCLQLDVCIGMHILIWKPSLPHNSKENKFSQSFQLIRIGNFFAALIDPHNLHSFRKMPSQSLQDSLFLASDQPGPPYLLLWCSQWCSCGHLRLDHSLLCGIVQCTAEHLALTY